MESTRSKLEITSHRGYSYLFLQFNYPVEEQENAGGAYIFLKILLLTYLQKRYKEQGREFRNDESFYTVRLTDNHAGFCISIEWEYLDEKKALDLVSDALDYVNSFDVDAYPDEETKATVIENIDQTKAMATALRKQIFEECLRTYKTEYVSFHD